MCCFKIWLFRLLAETQASAASNMPSSPKPIGPRERSISAPNVNMIGQPDHISLVEVNIFPLGFFIL